MSDEDNPTTVREAIRKGLAGNWTKELEDALFWPIAEFVDRSCGNVYEKGRQDTLENLREAGVLPKVTTTETAGVSDQAPSQP